MRGLPEECVKFQLFDREEVVINGEMLTGEEKNKSGWYYIGKKLSAEEVKDTHLLQGMKDNMWTGFVSVRAGCIYPLLENDIVLDYGD